MNEKIECPYLEGRYCFHRDNDKSSHRTQCPYKRNRKRCSLWKSSCTKIKDGLESLPEPDDKNERTLN